MKKTSTNPQIYFAKKDSMFGIKKGDRLIYDKVFVLERTGKTIPIDPSSEPEYFEIETPTKFKRDNLLMLEVATKLRPVGSGGLFTIPAFEPMRVVDVKITTSYRKKTTIYVMKMEHASQVKGDYRYEISEAALFPYETYYFVNSKGKVCIDIVGKDKAGDSFRQKVKNFFKTSDEANAYLKKLV